MNQLHQLERKLLNYSLDISRRKRKDLDRINKEFYINDYKRKYNLSQETVISALIGEEGMLQEYYRQQKEQKEYFSLLKKIRTPNIFEGKTTPRNKDSNGNGKNNNINNNNQKEEKNKNFP